MKTAHWYKVLVLGGAALSLGCLGEGAAPDAAVTAPDASGNAADAADAAREAAVDVADEAATAGCRVPCSGGICWG